MMDTLPQDWHSSETLQGAAGQAFQWGQETGVVWIGMILALLLLLHVLASWAEKKGWIYYRSTGAGGTGTALSNALAEFNAVVNPANEHRLEEERSQRIIASEAQSGRIRTGEGEDRLVIADLDDADENPPMRSA